jgi:hypothetical protein
MPNEGFKPYINNISKLLKILRKILEMDWDTTNPNKIFRSHENIYRIFQKSDLAL